jgi:hypothetical protein
MITYHEAETCLETYFRETTIVSRVLGLASTNPNSSNNTYTATGETEFDKKHGLSSFSSSSKTGDEGGSSQQTFWAPYGARASQITKATTFGQAWATSHSASSQSASQTSYTSSTIRSRAEQTRLNQFNETVTDVSSIAGTSTESSTTTTYQKTADGRALISGGQYTFTAPATETYSLTTNFWTFPSGVLSYTAISGSASATRTKSGSQTLSATGPHTVYLFGPVSALYAQLIYNERSPLPPTRNVAPVFVVTNTMSNGLHPINSVGLKSTFSWVKSHYSSQSSFTSTSSSSFVSGAASVTKQSTSAYDLFTVTSASSTLVNLSLIASRKAIDFYAYLNTDTGQPSFFATAEFQPSGLGMYDQSEMVFASIFLPNVFYPFIYTSIRSGLTVDGSSASAQWVRTNSAWSLQVTKKNSATSSTLFATLNLSGAISTSSQGATGVIASGNSPSAVLGPEIPLTLESMNILSITQSAQNNTADNIFYAISYPQTSSSVSSSSFSSSSTSRTQQIGSSGAAYAPATYANSAITAYKKRPALSFSTYSSSGHIAQLTMRTLSLPISFANSKLNEAGVSDHVPVVS